MTTSTFQNCAPKHEKKHVKTIVDINNCHCARNPVAICLGMCRFRLGIAAFCANPTTHTRTHTLQQDHHITEMCVRYTSTPKAFTRLLAASPQQHPHSFVSKFDTQNSNVLNRFENLNMTDPRSSSYCTSYNTLSPSLGLSAVNICPSLGAGSERAM